MPRISLSIYLSRCRAGARSASLHVAGGGGTSHCFCCGGLHSAVGRRHVGDRWRVFSSGCFFLLTFSLLRCSAKAAGGLDARGPAMPHCYSTAKRVWHSIQGVLPQTTGPLSAAAAARVGSASQYALRKTRGHCRLISGVQGSHARAPSPAAQRTTKLSPNATRRAFVCARRQSSIVAARRAARRIKCLCGGNAPPTSATWL